MSDPDTTAADVSVKLAKRIEFRTLDELVPYDNNPRTHPKRQLEQLAASILRFGFVNPILVSGGKIRAGHGRLAAARMIEDDNPGTFPDGLPVVELDHLSETEARAYLVADNRLAELSGWDEEALETELRELEAIGSESGDALEGLGFSEGELERILSVDIPGQEGGGGGGAGGLDDLDALEEPDEATAKLGDVWRCGDHVVVCGDSLDDATIRGAIDGKRLALVVTDPPYAIYGSSTGVGADVADDRMVRPFFKKVLKLADRVLEWFGHAYVFCDWRSWPAWHECSRSVATLEVKNVLVWDKKNSGLGSNYANGYELAGFLHRIPPKEHVFKKTATGIRSVHASNVLRFGRTGQGAGFEADHEDRERFHNAQKPVDLLRELLRNSSDHGQRVFDPFLGSGSTLIAAELEERRCVGIEIEPRRVDVSIARWERLTGRKAELVAELEESDAEEDAE